MLFERPPCRISRRGSFRTLSYVDPALLTGPAVECHKLVFSLAYRKRDGLEYMTTTLVEKQDVPGKSISHSVGPALHFLLLDLANA